MNLERRQPWIVSIVVLTCALLAGCRTSGVSLADPTDLTRHAGASATARTSGQASAAADPQLPVDGSFRIGKLANGLTYFVRANHKPENRAAIWLAVNAGAIQEDEDQLGLAHFVEHMAFNGTERFAKNEIVDYLETIGMRFGPDVNAYTSFDETVYMLELPTDDPAIVSRGFDILEDWAGAVSFEEEEIDKERGVVLEEWRLGRGAGARMRDLQFPILFKDSRYAERLPIGKKEILEHAPYDALRRFYRDWYRPDLMAVIAVGDFDEQQIEGEIRRRFSRLQNPASPRPRESYPVPDHAETLVTIATDAEATSSNVAVYYKLDKRGHRIEDYRRGVVESLCHAMLNARLDELRQKPAPPFLYAFSSSGGFVRTRDVYYQAAGVEEGGIERGLEALLTEVERVDRHGFNPSELERAKKDLLRGYEQSYRERDKRESGSFADETLRHFLAGEPMPGIEYELDIVRGFLPTIDLPEINRLVGEWITESNRVITVQAPKKDEPPTTDQVLLDLFAAVERMEIDPYLDDVRDEPLVAEVPRPGTVVATDRVEELDVTEWKLSNGVRVILKPTTFKNDELRLYGFSPGGSSLVPDADYLSASFATSVLDAGGIGDFDPTQLRKALAGKVAEAGTFISELEEGLSAEGSPDDVETLFQLLYLSATAPRVDPEAVASWLERQRGFIENRSARPETVFNDRMAVVLSQDHFRRRPLTVEMLDEIDLDKAARIHRDRFADAGDFTVVIVGNFEVDTIRPLVLTYLGGLPSDGRVESWRDPGVEPPDGVVSFDERKGLEPKSQVRITFNGPAEWSTQADHDMDSLSDALRIRLREVLREDMGGVYGVRVGGGISRRPSERYSFSVSFGCAPEKLEALIQAVFEQIERVKQEGVDAELVAKIKETQTRGRETDLEENRFWLYALANAYRHDEDPRDILKYAERVDSVSSERIQSAARRYLDLKRYVIGKLWPEEGERP